LTVDVDSVLLLLNETLPVFSWITDSQPLAPYLRQCTQLSMTLLN